MRPRWIHKASRRTTAFPLSYFSGACPHPECEAACLSSSLRSTQHTTLARYTMADMMDRKVHLPMAAAAPPMAPGNGNGASSPPVPLSSARVLASASAAASLAPSVSAPAVSSAAAVVAAVGGVPAAGVGSTPSPAAPGTGGTNTARSRRPPLPREAAYLDAKRSTFYESRREGEGHVDAVSLPVLYVDGVRLQPKQTEIWLCLRDGTNEEVQTTATSDGRRRINLPRDSSRRHRCAAYFALRYQPMMAYTEPRNFYSEDFLLLARAFAQRRAQDGSLVKRLTGHECSLVNVRLWNERRTIRGDLDLKLFEGMPDDKAREAAEALLVLPRGRNSAGQAVPPHAEAGGAGAMGSASGGLDVGATGGAVDGLPAAAAREIMSASRLVASHLGLGHSDRHMDRQMSLGNSHLGAAMAAATDRTGTGTIGGAGMAMATGGHGSSHRSGSSSGGHALDGRGAAAQPAWSGSGTGDRDHLHLQHQHQHVQQQHVQHQQLHPQQLHPPHHHQHQHPHHTQHHHSNRDASNGGAAFGYHSHNAGLRVQSLHASSSDDSLLQAVALPPGPLAPADSGQPGHMGSGGPLRFRHDDGEPSSKRKQLAPVRGSGSNAVGGAGSTGQPTGESSDNSQGSLSPKADPG